MYSRSDCSLLYDVHRMSLMAKRKCDLGLWIDMIMIVMSSGVNMDYDTVEM